MLVYFKTRKQLLKVNISFRKQSNKQQRKSILISAVDSYFISTDISRPIAEGAIYC